MSAADLWTESLLARPAALRGLTSARRAAISAAVPGRADGTLDAIAAACGLRARPLVARHAVAPARAAAGRKVIPA